MLLFQAAHEDDIPVLRALAERIWRGSYAEMISPEQMEYMLGRMYSEETIRRELAEGVLWELVRLSGEPIGFLSITFGTDGVAKLNKLYLLPELQGRGLGQGMLARVFAVAVERGAREVRLQVNKGNVRAQRVYERAGFRIAEAAVFDIGGGFVMDDFVMVRPLPG
jgi:ribosomal protein S18 acetylase RimI-like enzyme